MSTLDNIIIKYGKPAFIKIDVEGFEKEVILGLNQPVGGIMFEFTTPSFNEDTIFCINKLIDLGFSKFNISFGETLLLELSDWTDGSGLIIFIQSDNRCMGYSYGDIYALT